MTIEQLKNMIKDLPDDTPVVGFDEAGKDCYAGIEYNRQSKQLEVWIE
jgi:isocitrate dehydrogenase